MIKVFISYGHDNNTNIVKDLRSRLDIEIDENGDKKFDVFLDDDLTIGENWFVEIGKKIANSHYMIYFISAYSIREGSVCHEEIGYALYKGGITIIPVCLENVDVPFGIINLQRIEYFKKPDFEDMYKRILDRIGNLQKCNIQTKSPICLSNKSIKFENMQFLKEKIDNHKKTHTDYSEHELWEAHIHAGDIRLKNGNLKAAKINYEEAYKIAFKRKQSQQSCENTEMYFLSCTKIGDLATAEHNIKDAKKYYSKSLEAAISNSKSFKIKYHLVSYYNLAWAEKYDNNIPMARFYCEKALELAKELNKSSSNNKNKDDYDKVLKLWKILKIS